MPATGQRFGDLVRGAANSLSNPSVVFAWQPVSVADATNNALRSGFYQPMDAVSFRIVDGSGTEVIATTVVDLDDTNNLLDGDQAESGRLIILPFTVPTSSPTGTYTAEVTFTAHPTGGDALAEQTVTFPFRVLDETAGFTNSYAQLDDLVAQGFPVGQPPPCAGGYSYTKARVALERASRYVEEITGRIFGPHYMIHDHDGQGGPILQLNHAVVALTDLRLTFTTFSPADLPISEGDVRVYNRHARQRMIGKGDDDRQDPRIEFLRVASDYGAARGGFMGDTHLLSGRSTFTASGQNIQLSGVFGYTDWDGSPYGKVPDLIKEVTMRLAARYLQPLWQQVGGAGPAGTAAGPITVERTLDQAVSFANIAGEAGPGAYAGAFTGDPEIDQLLVLYKAPATYRSA